MTGGELAVGLIGGLGALISALILLTLNSLRDDVRELRREVAAGQDKVSDLKVDGGRIDAKIDSLGSKVDVMLGVVTRRIERVEQGYSIDLTSGEPRVAQRVVRIPSEPGNPDAPYQGSSDR